MVRSVMAGLKKSLHTRCLTRIELETVLQEIEACINSRPLTFVGDDVQDRKPLTPSSFLIGKMHMLEPEKLKTEDDLLIGSKNLENRRVVKNLLLDKFWNMWTTEYIRHLPQGKGQEGRCHSLQVGDLVMIKTISQGLDGP